MGHTKSQAVRDWDIHSQRQLEGGTYTVTGSYRVGHRQLEGGTYTVTDS